jgi:hypothetical protein
VIKISSQQLSLRCEFLMQKHNKYEIIGQHNYSQTPKLYSNNANNSEVDEILEN